MSEISHNRRDGNRTDDTDYSITSSLREQLHISQHASQQLDATYIAEQNLSSLLRSGTVVSTSSSFAERQQEASQSLLPQGFVEIGAGGCGVVYDWPGQCQVIKKAIRQFAKNEVQDYSLWNEFKMHRNIWIALDEAYIPGLQIPIQYSYHPENDKKWWGNHAEQFPTSDNTPAAVIISERILPLPKPVRDAMIELFCEPSLKQQSRDSAKNRDCLIRPVLGQRRHKIDDKGHMLRYPRLLNLRNFKLCVDQMEKLEMDVMGFASIYAQLLAVMHFVAKVDANDVKIVLGTAPSQLHRRLPPGQRISGPEPDGEAYEEPVPNKDFFHRDVRLWVIDFNMCRSLEGGPEFTRKAVKAFFDNATPFWPRPRYEADANPEDIRYWTHFKDVYIRTAKKHENTDQPERFIQAVEQYCRDKSQEGR